MTKIKACEKIIEQGGECEDVKCRECPFDPCENTKNIFEQAKQYIKEHQQEVKKYTIQFTESQIEQAVGHGSRLPDDIYSKFENCFKEISEPQIGDRCAFWNDDKSNYIIAKLEEIYNTNSPDKYKSCLYGADAFKNCAKIKKEAEF